MMKSIINIGIPSKGRLRADILKIFKKNKLNLVSERGKRDLLGSIKNLSNVKMLYLQNKINVVKKYEFGKATLVVAIPDPWIDVQTIADLEEIAFEFKDKKKKRLRVGTKYPNLTREFLFSKGVTQFKLVNSLGSTEVMPFTGSAEIIVDITSTGETIKANNLRVLKDGEILKSEACMMVSKSASKNIAFKKIVKLLSK